MEESRPSRSSARIALLLLLLLPPRTFGQVLREAPTPYHFVRYEDVPADQQSLAWPDDFWAPIKFIPLDIVPGSWVNFGGELRERVEHFSNPFFDLTPRGNTTYDMHRLLLQADLHIGEMFRAFVQFGNHLVTSPSMSPPTDVDRLDLQQGFGDLNIPAGKNASVTIRGGRQEIRFGRLVDVRESPNIRLNFDGVRVFYQSPALRIDAFGVAPVVPRPGVFDDTTNAELPSPGKAFWGLYGSVPIDAVPGLHVDPYYFGIAREMAPYDADVADELRHSVGMRFWGRADPWDCDVESVFQFGDFGDRDIRAWTVASTTGYTLTDVWGKPRLAVRADVASGGGSRGAPETLNPLYPNLAYFTEASLNSPNNFIDVYPAVYVQPLPRFAFMTGVDVLWRYSVDDGFYQPPGVPLVSSSANRERFLGAQFNLQAEWQATSHISVNLAFVYFLTAGFLQASGGDDVQFLGFWTYYRF